MRSYGQEALPYYFYLLLAFWTAVAALEFGQDYIDALFSGSNFEVYESLAYKVFWLLFVPGVLGYVFLLKELEFRLSHITYYVVIGILICIISLCQLVIFSLLLFGISRLIHEESWSLMLLLTEKLSSRLYIALAVYLTITVVYLRLNHLRTVPEILEKKYLCQLPVRVGKKSIVIDVDTVKYIKAEGSYVSLHTNDRKFVVFNSLKNLMKELDADQFKRIHRSTIVNVRSVAELKSRLNGDYDVFLKGGTELRLSRNYVKSVKGTLL